MKRYFLFATMLLLAAAACQEKENLGGETPEPGTTYTLEGTVAADGFTWKSDAALSLFSATDGVRIQNGKCAIASDGAGQATAKFTTPGIDLVAGENKLAVAYPYNASALYTSGRFTNFNLGDQTVAAPGVVADYIAAGYATGTPGTDETFKFELTPVTAVAEVKIGTSMAEYAGAKISKVSLQNSEVILGGGFNIDASSAVTLQPVDGKGTTSVAVNITTPEALSSTAQTVYVSLLPADFTGKDLNILLSGTDAAGEPLTITLKTSDVKFEAGKTTTLDFSDIKAEDVVVEAWYCNTDTRYLAGLGYAYGQANTFFIQCKNGVYNGGIFTENPEISDEVVIDYRIRGNRANITDDMIPDNVTFEWMTKSNGETIYTPYPLSEKGNTTGAIVDATTYTITPDPENYQVTVKNTGSYGGAPILLMKKNGKILWAWSFWNVAADGAVASDPDTKIASVKVGNYEFAPMDLGQPTTADAWSANTAEYMFRMNLLYQWGRPFPIFWTNFWYIDGFPANTDKRVPSVEGPLSLAQSLSTVAMIINTPENQSMQNWSSENNTDLWGTSDPEKDGEKSIYDPCPKGWRVATMPAIKALIASGAPTFQGADGAAHKNMTSMTLGGVLFYNNGYCNAKMANDPKKYLSNPENTNIQPGSIMQFGVSNSNDSLEGYIWTNAGGEAQASTMIWADPKRAEDKGYDYTVKTSTNDLSHVMSVRCIVDTENR